MDDPSTIAPGSVIVVRDEEWLVRATELTTDGLLVSAQGLGELVRDTEATFYASLDEIPPVPYTKDSLDAPHSKSVVSAQARCSLGVGRAIASCRRNARSTRSV